MSDLILDRSHGIVPNVRLGFWMALMVPLFSSCSDKQRSETEVRAPRASDLEPATIGRLVDSAPHLNWETLDSPQNDGWDSEVMAGEFAKRLTELSDALTSSGQASPDLNLWVDSSIEATALIPESLTRIERGSVAIERYTVTSDTPVYSRISEVSSRWFSDLNELTADSASLKLKVVSIQQLDPSSWETEVYFTTRKSSEQRAQFQQGRWMIGWLAPIGQEPKIETLELRWFERSTPLGDGRLFFSDCTESLLSNTDSFGEQVLQGVGDHARSLPLLNLGLGMASLRGFGMGDVNGDDLEDLYVCEDPGLPNRLYLQQPDGTMKEVSKGWECDWLEDSRSALLMDLDNDGDQDLAIGLYRGIAIFSNEDQRGFRLKKILPTHESVMHLCAADYDSDGRLDLYSCSYNPNELYKDRIGQTVVGDGIDHLFYDSEGGGSNHLFQNQTEDGSWDFADVTHKTGLNENNQRYSLAASWEDWDNDGDLDLYVANDFGRNSLYQNEVDSQGNHRFRDIAAVTRSEDQAPSMSINWGDYDRDGLMDLFVGNMWSAAGQRITTQSDFSQDAEPGMRPFYQRFTTGSTLLRNRSSKVFEDVSERAGVRLGRWAWASPFVDINNDGWEDLFVANGYISGRSDSGDL